MKLASHDSQKKNEEKFDECLVKLIAIASTGYCEVESCCFAETVELAVDCEEEVSCYFQ